MNVAENDTVVHGMLQDEYERCLLALEALERKVDAYPKGALNVRVKQIGGRQYSYHYLVAREGSRVVNRHIPKVQLPALKKQLAERDRCRQEMDTYKKRIVYLEKLLRIPGRKKSDRAQVA
ncbi:MAG: hypothetical protein WCP58_06415 [bacterium]